MPPLRTLDTLDFHNSYAALGDAFGQRVLPTALPSPTLLAFNPRAAALIDLDPREAARPDFARHFGGDLLPAGAEPVAMLYAGHQFGAWVPQLGDGRAILLGEVRNARGESWDLHLKGSGPTRYSRGFDGRSVLRSAIREFLAQEALHALGIPTTRGLCLVGSPAPVLREEVETAATLVRMAPTHVRFGSFEVFAHRGQHDLLRQLADYVVQRFFPTAASLEGTERYAAWLGEVVERTARMVAGWQAVGWCHGVMNTDNFSILGITLDFGPYGFLDGYDEEHICNHTDHDGRYAFHRQPAIAHWNCLALAQALLPLMPTEAAQQALDRFAPAFEAEYAERMRARCGLATALPDDFTLIGDLLAVLHQQRVDFTGFFRALARTPMHGPAAPARDWCPDPAPFDAWATRWQARLAAAGSDDAMRQARMLAVNPKYVLRNWVAQRAIDAAKAGDLSVLHTVLTLVQDPFGEHPAHEAFAAPPPAWAQGLVLSCSS